MGWSCSLSACCNPDVDGQASLGKGRSLGPRYRAEDIAPFFPMSALDLAHHIHEVETLLGRTAVAT